MVFRHGARTWKTTFCSSAHPCHFQLEASIFWVVWVWIDNWKLLRITHFQYLLLRECKAWSIAKPMPKWVCDYCSLGEQALFKDIGQNWAKLKCLFTHHLREPRMVVGPQLDPLECGTPIFCIFYGIISVIFLFAVYSNIKGMVIVAKTFNSMPSWMFQFQRAWDKRSSDAHNE